MAGDTSTAPRAAAAPAVPTVTDVPGTGAPAPGGGRPRRPLLRRAGSAGGAVAAQLAQAGASLLLQVVALRALGAEGLAVLALVYSGLVLLTALSSGLVGDSLTVLDRRSPRVRAGLVVVAVVVALLGSAGAGAAVRVAGVLGDGGAVVVAAATASFLLRDLVRRWLMAALRFGRVLAVDVLTLLATAGWLLLRSADLGLVDLFAALLAGQLAGLLLALALVPRAERRGAAAWRSPDVPAVLRYGVWRAAQQGVRPGTLVLVRLLVVAAVGTVAFGQLEAARVYAAPAMLVLSGGAGFLFASYAARRADGMRVLLASADRGAVVLVLAAGLTGVVAVVGAPLLGPLLTGGSFGLDLVAVVGWCAYAAAAATLTPYASLAAVGGRHVAVLLVRLLELGVSVGAVALVLALDVGAAWVPLALCLGPLGCALVVRRGLLVPLVARGVPLVPAAGAAR